MRQGRNEDAETALRTALDCARRQQAKSWELRAALSLATLLAQTGWPAAARQLLAPALDWFTEGRDTPDLAEAATLLKTLGEGTPVGSEPASG